MRERNVKAERRASSESRKATMTRSWCIEVEKEGFVGGGIFGLYEEVKVRMLSCRVLLPALA